MRFARRAMAVVLAVLPMAACQTYSTVPMTQLKPASAIRLYLNDAGRQTLSTQVGPYVEYLDGTIRSLGADSLVMNIATIQRFSGPAEVYPKYAPVAIPDSVILSVGVRHVSATKSLLLAGAIVAGSAIALEAGNSGASSSGPAPGGSSSGH